MTGMVRKYRTGALYQRRSDGRWIGAVPDGHGGVARYVTGTSKDAVEKRLNEARRSTTSLPRGRAASETLAAYLGRWLATRDGRLAPRTIAGYRIVVERHIVPVLGRVRLSELEAIDVQEMVDGVASRRSAQTAKHARNVLSAALRQAVTWGLVPVNVARSVEAPAVRRKPPVYLSPGQVRAFLDSTRDDPRHAFYVLAMTTAMRRGEMLALRWQDVDLDAGEVDVNATLRQVSRWRFRRDPTKTVRSERRVPLNEEAVQALRDYRRDHATSTGFVFARPDGRPWPPAEVTREFQARLKAAGIPKARLHDTRHTAITVALDAGEDPRTVADWAGDQVSTILNTYSGRAAGSRRRIADTMTEALRRQEG